MAWQDWLVTGVAVMAAVIVFLKTVGSWKDSKPGGAGTPHCDSCAVAEIAKETNAGNEEMAEMRK